MNTGSVSIQKHIFFFVVVFFSIFLLSVGNLAVFSGDLDEYEQKLEEKRKEKEEAESYLEYIKGEIHRIQNSGYSLDQQIRMMDEELKKVEREMERVLNEIEEKIKYIAEKEKELEEKQEQVNSISDRLYKNSRLSFIDILFSSANDYNMIHSLILNRFVISSQVAYMRGVANDMIALNTEREELEGEKQKFEKDQEEMKESKGLLAQQRANVQAELNRQVAERNMVTRRVGGLQREISELQNFLLIMKSGGTVVNAENLKSGTGTGSLAHFQGNAPSGTFGVFSFGAYTHRNGMSQWGARARADAGQSHQDILRFYYPNTKITTNEITINGKVEDITSEIEIAGHGVKSFEDHYLLGIKEVPESWNLEVLKAQAIAARTYALRYTNNGRNRICTDENCQVFGTPLKTGNWKKAVEDTRGMVLTDSQGVPSFTEYAAVHGGWVNNVGFDVRSTRGSWIEEAWDNLSGVSWFYRNWHTKGYGSEVCSTHPSPWLTNAEMADIVNAYLYWSHESVSSDSRLTAVDIGTCWGKTDANPYSASEMKEKVKSVGRTPVNSISRVAVTNKNGWTTAINFNTDVGAIAINNPTVFREVYNMRAPAYFSIPQSTFVHFNIVMK